MSMLAFWYDKIAIPQYGCVIFLSVVTPYGGVHIDIRGLLGAELIAEAVSVDEMLDKEAIAEKVFKEMIMRAWRDLGNLLSISLRFHSTKR
jgi:hypothetical protein